MLRDFINVKDISQKLEHNSLKVMWDAESNYRGQLFKAANMVLKNQKKYKMFLLGGPSCAGKTTTANILKEIIESKRRRAIIISMDNFFLDRDATPLLPNGRKDFDSLRAVNLEQMQRCFTELFTKGKAKFPMYDFKTGKNVENFYELDNRDNPIIIFEGLHVLNPDFIKFIGTDKYFKMYISTISGFSGSDGVKMSTRQVRLIRRMIRDIERRGYSPETTLKNWKDVCDAEDAYIAPYKENVDYYINTTHSYEIALYKSELFKIVCSNREVLNQFTFLNLFDETTFLDKEQLPDTTLMWEFIDKPIRQSQSEVVIEKSKNQKK